MSKEDDFETSVNEFRKVHQKTCNYDENELWKEFARALSFYVLN